MSFGCVIENCSVYVVIWKLLFTGNIPRGVFCERRSQKTRDIPREFMRLA